MAKISKNKVLTAIKGSGGVILSVAKKLDVEWHTAKTYINKWPETIQAYENEEEAILDIADMALYNAVKKEESWAVKWIQSTKGKERGYVEKSEIDHTTKGKELQQPIMFMSVDKLTDDQIEKYLSRNAKLDNEIT